MATDWKKILQAGALATDAMSKGSAGGLGKALVESGIDLSGKGKGKTTENTTTQSGASKGAKDVKSFDEQPTENQAGKKFGGQGNKRRNMSYTEIE